MHPFAQATPLPTPTSAETEKTHFLPRARESIFSKTPNLADTIHRYILTEVDLNDVPEPETEQEHKCERPMSELSTEHISDLALRSLPDATPHTVELPIGSEPKNISISHDVPLYPRSQRLRKSKLSSKVHLVLHRQNNLSDEGPVYGRNASIEGVVLMDRDDGVSSIEAMVRFTCSRLTILSSPPKF
jgi:hypothetical protein